MPLPITERNVLRAAALSALVLLVAACASAPEGGDDPHALQFEIQEFHSDKLVDGQPIRIVNPWGNIELRKASGPGAFEVTAAIQRIGERPPAPPEFVQRVVDGQVELQVRFRGARLEPARTGRVDLAVFVPAGHPLELEARDGLIKAKKTANPIQARTTSGDIYIVNDGPIRARSEHGRVQVRPMYDPWEIVDLRSDHGTVVAFLPNVAAYELSVEGTADIHSEILLESVGAQRVAHHAGLGGEPNRVRLHAGGSIEIYEALLPDDGVEDDPSSSGP